MQLINFASELLESILYYTLPDLTDVRWSGNDKAVYVLYASPILQVNRLLRQVGFTVINTKYIWVHIHLHRDLHVRLVRKMIARGLAIVPPWLQPHVSSSAPKVHIEVTWTRTRMQQEPTHDEKECQAIMLPYNFDILLQIWNVIDASSVRVTTYATVRFWYANMSTSLERRMRDLVSPTRTILYLCYNLDVWYEGSLSTPRTARSSRIENALGCLTELLDNAENLVQSGCQEEAGLLMLYNRSRLRYIDDLITSDFSYFEQLSEAAAREYFESTLRPLNQIRHMFWYINQGASLTFARLYVKYGHEWYSRRDQKPIWLFPGGMRIRLNDWYGLSSSELARWHCRRSMEVEAACDMKRKSPAGSDSLYKWGLTTAEIAKVTLSEALIEVEIARLLNSEDECARRLQSRYVEALTKDDVATARNKSRSYFLSLSIPGLQIDKSWNNFAWEGDSRVFGINDAGFLLRHTLLAQDFGGMEARWPNYVACLDGFILDCVQAPPPETRI